MAGKNVIRNIAVIRLDRVGDLILTTPALAVLRKNFPSATISAIVSPYTKEVLDGNRSIDEIITVGDDSYTKPFSVFSAFSAGRLLRDKKFDIAIVFSPHTNAYALAFGLGASRRIGYTYASRRFTRVFSSFLLTDWVNEPPDQVEVDNRDINVPHEIEQNISLVSYILQKDSLAIPDPELHVTATDENFAKEFLSKHNVAINMPVLGLHLSIRWKPSIPNNVLDKLIKRMADIWEGPILITSGPAEQQWRKEIEPIIENINKKYNNSSSNMKIITAESLSLKQWAALIKLCRVFISPDTGSLHVASAMKTPTISVMEEKFFKYHSQRWAPWSVPYVIVRKPEIFIFEQFVFDIERALKQLTESIQRSNNTCQIK